jgi:redox-sensitive bicupin YhaK (pirin superfamily)
MKKIINRSEERGRNKLDWLDSKFSFSFANYNDPKRQGFGKLLVFNDDIIESGKGFGAHPHENMEIISIPFEGSLTHKDSTGSEETVGIGEVQVMSAGSGIFHSEFNSSNIEKANFFQIWIEPNNLGIKPSHKKKKFNLEKNKLNLIVSGSGEMGSLKINQDSKIYQAEFDIEKKFDYSITDNFGVFIFVVSGNIKIDGDFIGVRDSIEIFGPGRFSIMAEARSDFLIIEVPLD